MQPYRDPGIDIALHKVNFTMSDLHILFGLDSQTTRNVLMKYKSGERERQVDQFLQKIFDFGHNMEPLALNYLYLLGYPVRHDHPMLIKDRTGGTIDGIFTHRTLGEVIIEVKWRVVFKGNYAPDLVLLGPTRPKHYCQLAGYLGLYNVNYGILVECCLTEGMRVTWFRRDPEFWEVAKKKMQEFITLWDTDSTYSIRKKGVAAADKQFILDSMEKTFICCNVYPSFYLFRNGTNLHDKISKP